ncbi:hypothetical protein COCOBI_pt-0920 (chloroplast) [Coccomyxa sp. Obi]|nr:hypothetical protein COCOBI_pt-0920 [Coccomyxa sp. Obi]
MDRVSEPVVTQILVKQQDISSSEKPVGVGITAAEKIRRNSTAIETPETGSATISSSSGLTQNLAGGLPLAGSMPTQQSPPLRHSDGSAKSLSRRNTPTLSQMAQLRAAGLTPPPPPPPPPPNTRVEASVQSEFRSGSVSTRLSQFGKKFNRRLVDCCGIVAGNKGSHFNKLIARDKGDHWNEMLVTLIKDEHKPKSLKQDLSHHDNGIFRSSDTKDNPLCVFAHEDRARVLTHVEHLRDTEGGPSGATLYDPDQIIFEVSIPPGTYIKAFTFIDNYTEKTDSAKDDRGHKLLYAGLKDDKDELLIEGLVNPEKAPEHWSISHWKSSTHADLYMRRGKKADKWACVGAISNHTGTAREPKKASKLNRIATYKR